MTSVVKEKRSSVVVDGSHGDVTDNIMANMDSLSLKEKEADIPLVRHVTIDGNDYTSRPSAFQADLSPTMEAPAPSRLCLCRS